MADFRNIHTRIWTDAWFSELAIDEKLLFVYLFSNPSASVSGIYEIPIRNISMDTGIAKNRVSAILDTFSKAGKVYYENGIVWVVNLNKYNNSGDSVKIKRCIEKDLAQISDCPIKRLYFERNNIPYPEQKIPYPESALIRDDTIRDDTRLDEPQSKAKDALPKTQEAGLYPIAKALSKVTGLDFEKNRGRLFKDSKGFKPEDVQKIITNYSPGGAWYQNDWRGKKGQRPTSANIRETWDILLPVREVADGYEFINPITA